jgi:hypothetical protein
MLLNSEIKGLKYLFGYYSQWSRFLSIQLKLILRVQGVIVWIGSDWIKLDQDRYQLRALVNVLCDDPLQYNTGNLTNCGYYFSRRTLFHGVS